MSKGFPDPSRILIWAYQSILIFQNIQLIFFSTLQTIWKVLIITENLKVEISDIRKSKIVGFSSQISLS